MSKLKELVEKAAPGPWKATFDWKCSNGETTSGVTNAVNSAAAWPSGRSDLEEIANARLIAKAPELAALVMELAAIISEHKALYAHVWDRTDGAICIMSKESIDRFEDAHEAGDLALAKVKALEESL